MAGSTHESTSIQVREVVGVFDSFQAFGLPSQERNTERGKDAMALRMLSFAPECFSLFERPSIGGCEDEHQDNEAGPQ